MLSSCSTPRQQAAPASQPAGACSCHLATLNAPPRVAADCRAPTLAPSPPSRPGLPSNTGMSRGSRGDQGRNRPAAAACTATLTSACTRCTYLPCIHPDHQYQHQVDRDAWTAWFGSWHEQTTHGWRAKLAAGLHLWPLLHHRSLLPQLHWQPHTSSWPRALVNSTTQSHAAGLCLQGVCAGPASS